MLLLTTTTDKFQLVTGAVASIDVHASFVDLAGQSVTPGRQNASIPTATTTDIVASPASGTYRNVKSAYVRNKHASASCDVTWLFNQNGTLYELYKTTLAPGETLAYEEQIGFVKLSGASTGFGDQLLRAIDADQVGADVATAQNWFPTLGALTVEAGVSYLFDGLLRALRGAGITSHTTSLLFGGTATLTGIQYSARCNSTDTDANGNANQVSAEVATATEFKGASVSATEAFALKVNGIARISAAGTFIPQFQYSVAPGGAPTIQANSYFRMMKLGAGFTQRGVWT